MRSRNFRVIFVSATVGVEAAIPGSGVVDITNQKRSRAAAESRSGVSLRRVFHHGDAHIAILLLFYEAEVCSATGEPKMPNRFGFKLLQVNLNLVIETQLLFCNFSVRE